MNSELEKFYNERVKRIDSYSDKKKSFLKTIVSLLEIDYEYNFDILGRPVIAFPQDVVAMDEIIWNTKPDLIIETGIAHGGSIINSAKNLALLDLVDGVIENKNINPRESKRKVVGIDIDIRSHNKKLIQEHPLSSRIEMIEGSSIESGTVEKVYKIAERYEKIMICLDSNHTYEHVSKELEIYAPLTSVGNYCIVLDTTIDFMPQSLLSKKPWAKGNSPRTAALKFIKENPNFEVDKRIENKLLLTNGIDGYLKRIK